MHMCGSLLQSPLPLLFNVSIVATVDPTPRSRAPMLRPRLFDNVKYCGPSADERNIANPSTLQRSRYV
jgi:hypothetical protein